MSPFILCHGKKLSAAIGCLVSIVCCIGLGLAAQAPQAPVGIAPAQTAAPTLKITVREVLLDVLITDKAGQPVTGLKAADFTVTEEGQPQVIRRLNEHHPMSAADVDKLTAAPALPPNTFTNFTPVRNTNASTVLLLDAMDSPIGAQMMMREQLINYLKHMQPGPPIAIFQLDTEMRLIQGFTSDPKVLLAAAESKRDMPSLAKPTAAPRSYTADALYRRVLSETLRNGMRVLGSYLAGFPGRKNLIWFTGQVPMTIMGFGFGNPFRDGLTVNGGTGDELTDLTDVLTVSRVAVYPVDTRGLSAAPDQFGAGQRRAAFPNPGSRVFDHTNMDMVAEQTGGNAYYNTNDFAHVIAEVVNNGSSYYTIAYATTNNKWNGKLRHIKVAVDRPEVHLQHREGYYAYSMDKREQSGIASIEKRRTDAAAQQEGSEMQTGSQPPAAAQDAGSIANSPDAGATVRQSPTGGFGLAMGLGAIPPTEIVFVARLQADANAEKLGKQSPMPPHNFLKPEWQHKPFRNYTIVFKADARRIRLTQTPEGTRHGAVEFATVVYSADGQQVNSLIMTASFDLTADEYRNLLASGLPAKEEIAIPVKGNFFLRLGVHDVTGDQVGALEIPVDQVKLGATGAGPQTP
jgi:VWFA-related protein